MEDAMVSSSTGAMNFVLSKLVTLTGDRYAELTGADKQELMMLRQKLQVMNALLKQLSDTADLDIQMKGCRNQMRELTYVIADSIDDLLSVNKQSSGSTGKRIMPHSFIEQIRKVKARVKKADLGSMVSRTEKNEEGSGSTGKRVMPHDFIEQIQELNAQVEKTDLGSTVRRTEKIEEGSASTGKRVMPHGFIEQIRKVKARVDKADLGSMVSRTEKNEEGSGSTGKRVMPHGFIEQIKDLNVQVEKADLGSTVRRTEENEEGSESTGKRVMPHDFIEQIQKLNEQMEKADLGSMVRRTQERTFGPRHMPSEQLLSYYDERAKPCVERDQPSVETMRKTFAHLSSDMKTCILYLSSFPANHMVRTDRLIRRWAAEGFLPKRSMESLLETGESYFLELIDMKLIEPVYIGKEDVLLPTGCKVSDSVHGFITALSSEENFVKPGKDGVFWQISGDIKQQLAALFKELSKVRSLTIHTDFGSRWWTHDLSPFKHLRVLDLEDLRIAWDEEDLRVIGHLSLLRYLGLAGAALRSVPQEIIALEHLETVDLRHTRLDYLPAFESRKLVSFIAGRITLQEGMGEMQVLEELATVVVGDDGDRLAKVVNQSKRLRRLDVIFDHQEVSADGRKGVMDLLGEIGNSDIRSLRIFAMPGSVLHLLLDYWAQQRSRHLQKFELTIYGVLPEVPRNMSASLTHLSIIVERVDTEGLCILGNLPNLVFLSLRHGAKTERSIISKNGFRCLRVLWYDSLWSGMVLQFVAGAMPQLRRLRLMFDVKATESKFGGFDFGIQFLTCLVQVHASINCDRSTAASVEAVEGAMKDQVYENPNNPVLEITRREELGMVRDTVRDEGHTSYVEDKDRKSPMFQSEIEQKTDPRPLTSFDSN